MFTNWALESAPSRLTALLWAHMKGIPGEGPLPRAQGCAENCGSAGPQHPPRRRPRGSRFAVPTADLLGALPPSLCPPPRGRRCPEETWRTEGLGSLSLPPGKLPPRSRPSDKDRRGEGGLRGPSCPAPGTGSLFHVSRTSQDLPETTPWSLLTEMHLQQEVLPSVSGATSLSPPLRTQFKCHFLQEAPPDHCHAR